MCAGANHYRDVPQQALMLAVGPVQQQDMLIDLTLGLWTGMRCCGSHVVISLAMALHSINA